MGECSGTSFLKSKIYRRKQIITQETLYRLPRGRPRPGRVGWLGQGHTMICGSKASMPFALPRQSPFSDSPASGGALGSSLAITLGLFESSPGALSCLLQASLSDRLPRGLHVPSWASPAGFCRPSWCQARIVTAPGHALPPPRFWGSEAGSVAVCGDLRIAPMRMSPACPGWPEAIPPCGTGLLAEPTAKPSAAPGGGIRTHSQARSLPSTASERCLCVISLSLFRKSVFFLI